jgi:hypothetical protein
MTWMTPLDASMSVAVTLASFDHHGIAVDGDGDVGALGGGGALQADTSAAITLPGTTWYRRMSASASGSASNASSVPGSRAANASSVGANTV